jgi:glycosyltransferase involved in cell wall biosynthesis
VPPADGGHPLASSAPGPAIEIPGAGRPRLLAYTDNTGIGGAEMSLATLLVTLGDAVDPTIMGTDRAIVGWIAERVPGVQAVVLPHARDKRDVTAIAAHVRAVRSHRPHIFHANLHHSWSGAYGLLAAFMAPGVKTVAVEHSLWPVYTRGQRARRRSMAGRLDAHVAVSARLARDVEELIGCPAGSIETIHNGVADVRVEPLPRLRAEPTIGFVGRLAEEKGVDLLLHALRDLPDAAAVLVGDGPDRGALERLAVELGLADRVVFAGWSDDVRRLLPTFDVLAQPSRREGFGISIVEAMLAELPVVATDAGGMAEVVADGVTGFTVAAENAPALGAALGTLLADPERRREMGARGREIALQHFAAEAMAGSFARLYGRILAP